MLNCTRAQKNKFKQRGSISYSKRNVETNNIQFTRKRLQSLLTEIEWRWLSSNTLRTQKVNM